MTTKERILETALELFSQRGYGGVSVRDIARAVGIRESSIYNHFENKRAVFDGIVDFCVQQSEQYFRGAALRDRLAEVFGIDKERYMIQLVLALGKPKEEVKVVPVGEDGKVTYYRGQNQIHYVPKRSLEDLILD